MSRHRTLVLFVAAAVLFGTSFVGIKAALGPVPPVLFAAFRVDVAAVALLALVAARGGYWLPRNRADVLGILASAAFVLGANNVLLFLGQQHATTGAAAVMYSFVPVASPVFAVLLLDDERVTAFDGAGILLGLLGVVVIVGPGSILSGGAGSIGQALVFGAAVSVALGTVLMKRAGPTIGTIPLTAWAMALAAVSIHVVSLGIGESPAQVPWTPTIVAAILYVGMPATAAAYPVYFALLAEAGPVRGNLVAYAVPVVATLAGWALLGETISTATILGFGVILAGFLVVQRKSVLRLVGWGATAAVEPE
ncbi:DMT family transporter [Haloferax sp. S1W]|uniref:DMT family transporter n=1 Tax=Haloferax sp. S1W TaxID=3377110 RepID=UPI0037C57EEC